MPHQRLEPLDDGQRVLEQITLQASEAIGRIAPLTGCLVSSSARPAFSFRPIMKCRLSTRSVASSAGKRPRATSASSRAVVAVSWTWSRSARLRTPCTIGKMPAFFRSRLVFS
jgi:hypothetical protein